MLEWENGVLLVWENHTSIDIRYSYYSNLKVNLFVLNTLLTWKSVLFFHSYKTYYDIHVLYFIHMNTSISTLHLNITCIIWMDCMFWILGESGLGKSTLINSLFLTDLYSADYQGPSHRIQKTVKVGVPPLSKQV